MQSPKIYAFRFLLSAFSFLFVFLLFEAGLRIAYAVDRTRGGNLEERLLRSRLNRVKSDQETDFGDMVQSSAFTNIVYEFKPDIDCIFRDKRVTTNSRGLRDREHKLQKPAGTFRIVGLGDSVMFGWGVGQAELYLAVLERSLNALPQPHPLYEAINFAVPGYNTAIEVATFEHKALAYAPDLIVMQFINNDFGVPNFMLRPKPSFTWRKSYAWEFVRARLGRLKRTYDDEHLVFSEFRNVNEEERANVLKEYRYMVGASGYRRAMDRLGQLAKERGIPVIIMIGTLGTDQRAVVLDLVDQWNFQALDIGPVTKRVLKRNGIPDTEEDFRRVGWVSRSDHHPNAFGHTIYAEGLLELMGIMGLAPKAGP
ncbi:MAG: SGNH/GDSL hydrolase family protein [Lentisphaerae bacterium]|nr:SGNH/GDSL hydrolase family protein [Lentisphaerota bacterium]